MRFSTRDLLPLRHVSISEIPHGFKFIPTVLLRIRTFSVSAKIFHTKLGLILASRAPDGVLLVVRCVGSSQSLWFK